MLAAVESFFRIIPKCNDAIFRRKEFNNVIVLIVGDVAVVAESSSYDL